ncbi:hypothetical protein [Rhizobium favelukesii]|uniref:hypothetical protein n=1 Tax=Rhizobium favelukesii TaxID=348824 RepID=UPI00056CACD3|nr:hypothetical protein [Rhizobium favelukesii]
MDSMVEKVASALLAETQNMGALAHHIPIETRLARVAIEAMREPTPEMIKEAYDNRDPGFCDEPGDVMTPEETWGHMISAALKEEEKVG